MSSNGKRRRGRGRKGGHEGGYEGRHSRSDNYSGPPIDLVPGMLPSDEQLEVEIAALELELKEKYEGAKKTDFGIERLHQLTQEELVKEAKKIGVEDLVQPKQRLIFEIMRIEAEKFGLMVAEGTLEVLPEGFGFLRSADYSYMASPDDVYVSPAQIRHFGLRKGHVVRGLVRPPKDQEVYFAMLKVESVNGRSPSVLADLPVFESLTPLHPNKRIHLEVLGSGRVETRIIDMVTPLGFGQRALIVAPPRTGKTVILQQITNAIAVNHPDVHVIVLLVDERPEEVTDFRRNTPPHVEVVASTFDEEAGRHIQVAEMVAEKARRLVEFGEHVVILLDSITRLARGYNNALPNSGKIGSGGVDNSALIKPKKFFGSARNIENGGSLTILGTALVDTGSRADEVIFEEFKGTGNAELHLDRKLVEKRVYPAINISASGTRREELLLDPKEHELIIRLRKVVSDMNTVDAMEMLRTRVAKTKSNAEFLMTMSMG